MPPLAIRALAHLPFYEALAVLDDASDDWRALSAGLLALRLVDRWTEDARAHRRLSRWEISGVAEAVEAVPVTTPVRSILSSIVTAATDQQSPSAALPMLAAYARALQYDARWGVAADVYDSVVTYAGAIDADLAIPSAYQRGFCLRMGGDLDGAYQSYRTGRALALRTADLSAVLQADIGLAALATQRGNLPAAQAALDDVITRAEPAGHACVIMLSQALHDRGVVAARRERFDEAVSFCHRALTLCSEPEKRDRIIGDIAGMLGNLGQYEAARDANLVLYATARAQDVRWTAALNLLELAGWTNNEPSFERYRRELAAAPLSPVLRAYFHLHVAEGYAALESYGPAAQAFEEAIEAASAAGLNEVAFAAESGLKALGSRKTAIRTTFPETQTAAVNEAAVAMRRLREEATAAV